MDEPEYTIGELAQQAGVTPRTIRYYTAEGLLPQPDTRGRYARYSQEHLHKLDQIAQLKAQYLPLHVIRERLTARPPAPPPFALSPRVPQPPPHPTRPPAHLAGTGAAEQPPALAGRTLGDDGQPLQLGRYQFFPYAEDSAEAAGNDAPLAAAERWQRIVIAPGVELHMREPISAERRERLDALVAAARDQLAGEA